MGCYTIYCCICGAPAEYVIILRDIKDENDESFVLNSRNIDSKDFTNEDISFLENIYVLTPKGIDKDFNNLYCDSGEIYSNSECKYIINTFSYGKYPNAILIHKTCCEILLYDLKLDYNEHFLFYAIWYLRNRDGILPFTYNDPIYETMEQFCYMNRYDEQYWLFKSPSTIPIFHYLEDKFIKNKSGNEYFDLLPIEIIEIILSFLDIKSILSFSETCKHINFVIKKSLYWKNKINNKYINSLIKNTDEYVNWFLFYKELINSKNIKNFKRIFNKINELLTYFENFQSIGKKAANVFWEKYDSPYTFYDNSDYIEYCKNLDEIYVIEYIDFIH